MKNLFMVVCVGTLLYWTHGYLKDRKSTKAYAAFEASEPRNRPSSQCGFTDVLRIDGVGPLVLTVLMPCGCPLEAGQRGLALVEKIKAANIPVTATTEVRATIKGRSREEMEAKMEMMNSLMSGETPIVLYRGRAKNNPTFDDVLTEYRTSR